MLNKSGRLITLFLIINLIFAAEIEISGLYQDQKDNRVGSGFESLRAHFNKYNSLNTVNQALRK